MGNQIKETTLTWVSLKTKDLTWTLGLALLSVVLPALLAHTPNNQWITGSVVNAILFISAWRLGMANAFFVAALPSTVALLRGLLPAPMASMIPYIIFSNIILIAIFFALKKNLFFAVTFASLAKFLVLYTVSSLLLSSLNSPLIVMMQWPQFTTALAGGLVAMGVIQLGVKNKL